MQFRGYDSQISAILLSVIPCLQGKPDKSKQTKEIEGVNHYSFFFFFFAEEILAKI